MAYFIYSFCRISGVRASQFFISECLSFNCFCIVLGETMPFAYQPRIAFLSKKVHYDTTQNRFSNFKGPCGRISQKAVSIHTFGLLIRCFPTTVSGSWLRSHKASRMILTAKDQPSLLADVWD